MKNFIIGILLIAILGLVLYFAPRTKAPIQEPSNQPVVVDFQTCVAAGFPLSQTSPATCTTPNGQIYTDSLVVPTEDVIITSPVIGEIVTSPMTIKGQVRGNWFFEANLPIELQDENGKVLAQVGDQTSDNWMTTDYINIETTLKFPAPKTDYGKLVIKKDNPSGDPEYDKSFEVPVRFK